MKWTHLLPLEPVPPGGSAAPEPRQFTRWPAQPPPADPATVPFQEALHRAHYALEGHEDVVRGWPAEFRRRAALREHLDAVDSGGPPDDTPVRLIPLLAGEGIAWSRADLAWALATAERYGCFDGAAFALPGHIALSLTREELEGFGPALRAVLDEFIDEWDTPRATRKHLAELYGTAIGRLAGRLPLDLLPWSDPFGCYTRERLDRHLDAPEVTAVLRHATTLAKPKPTRAWLRAAAALPADLPARAILGCLVDYDGAVSFLSDDLLRGLAWMVSLNPSDGTTDLLGEAALAAGRAHHEAPGFPYAPQAAVALAEILLTRSGEFPARVLDEMCETVQNRALLSRVRSARLRLAV
ncbi:hypothetical protein [Paractinoplanes deccanensis]|uniref:hypothetical protein n=1 Tax=Paractinoplanes deccanensis TaxID=113561 RepID=UPI0019453D59|nr:hypothetical protein [Actinoplanes deccanensis]